MELTNYRRMFEFKSDDNYRDGQYALRSSYVVYRRNSHEMNVTSSTRLRTKYFEATERVFNYTPKRFTHRTVVRTITTVYLPEIVFTDVLANRIWFSVRVCKRARRSVGFSLFRRWDVYRSEIRPVYPRDDAKRLFVSNYYARRYLCVCRGTLSDRSRAPA